MKRTAMLILLSMVLFSGCSGKQDDASVASEIQASASAPVPTTAPENPVTDATARPSLQAPTTVAAAAPAPVAAPPPPLQQQARKVVIPEGTTVRVVTVDAIDANPDKINSTYLASLNSPITLGNEVIIPERTNVYLRLLDASKSSKLKGKSSILVTLDSVEFNGDRYILQSSNQDVEGKSQGKQTAKKVGIGAALGTAVGAIAGGGKGAAIGAAAGAGGGLAAQALGKGEHLEIPSETKLEFNLEKALELALPAGY